MGILQKSLESRRSKKHYIITFNKEIIRDVLADVDFSKKLAEQPTEQPTEQPQERQEETQERNVTLATAKTQRPANDGFDDTPEGWKSYLKDLLGHLENPSKISGKPPDSG